MLEKKQKTHFFAFPASNDSPESKKSTNNSIAYLSKIFQISFYLQRIRTSLSSFLHKLLKICQVKSPIHMERGRKNSFQKEIIGREGSGLCNSGGRAVLGQSFVVAFLDRTQGGIEPIYIPVRYPGLHGR